MPKVEPFEYQKSTNIDEHNQIVNKVNELVDVVNDVNLDQITPEIDALKTATTKNTTDISQLKISDAEHTEQIATIDSNLDNHAREITALKAKDATHDTEIAELDKVTDALTKEIPNGITLYRDGTGKIKAVISQEDDTTIDSNVLDMIIPYQYDIISGTTSRSFKLDITMSDGTKYTTNDFVIPAGGGTSVSITAITLTKNADNPNKFKVSVKLDDGSTIESGEIEMVTSVSGTFANNKLTITVNGISSTPITIDTTGTTYTAGTGIKIASGVISIDDTKVALKSDISDMETKTHANATFATKTELAKKADATTVTQIQTAVGDCFNEVALGSDGKSLDFTAVDGQVNNIVLPSFSPYRYSVAESIDLLDSTALSNFFNNFDTGYYVFIGNATMKFNYNDMSWYSAFSCLYLIKGSAYGNILNNGDSYMSKKEDQDTKACFPGILFKDTDSDTKYIATNFYFGELKFIEYIKNYGSTITTINFTNYLNASFTGIWLKITSDVY